MEKLPITFVQATVDPDIQECFDPAFNFTKINASNGRLAFTEGRLYWLPYEPIAMLDQGWVINYAEIASYAKTGLAGFCIRLVDGKELQFSNVGKKMREGIEEALAAHKGDAVPEAPAAAPAGAAAPGTAPAEPAPQQSNSKKTIIIAVAAVVILLLLMLI